MTAGAHAPTNPPNQSLTRASRHVEAQSSNRLDGRRQAMAKAKNNLRLSVQT